PATPPAGPDISRLTGNSCAVFEDDNPPSDRRMCSFTDRDFSSSFAVRLLTYRCTCGRTYEFATVVTVRSYSCISGTTSHDNDTGMPGSSSRATSRTRRSCMSFAYELIRHTVKASMFL